MYQYFIIIILIAIIFISLYPTNKTNYIHENLECNNGCIDNNICYQNTRSDCPSYNGCLSFYDSKGNFHNPCGKYIGKNFSVSECIGCKHCKYCLYNLKSRGICIPRRDFSCKLCPYSFPCYRNAVLEDKYRRRL